MYMIQVTKVQIAMSNRTPADCNWNEFQPHGECIYNGRGDLSNGQCQCYPGWNGIACEIQTTSYEPGSACDQDCSSQCLDDFPTLHSQFQLLHKMDP